MNEEELLKAIKRHEKRRQRFMVEGLSADEAYDLAEKLFDRDQDPMDTRRLCFECSQYVDTTKGCLQMRDSRGRPLIPMRFLLQRCSTFTLREVKK